MLSKTCGTPDLMDERAGKGVIVYAAIISQEGGRGREGAFKKEGSRQQGRSPLPLLTLTIPLPLKLSGNEEFGSANH